MRTDQELSELIASVPARRLGALLHGTRPDELVPKGRAIHPGSLTAAPTDEMLRNYVALVRKWRKASSRERVKFRHSDLGVLVTVLGPDAAKIERRLVAITPCSRPSTGGWGVYWTSPGRSRAAVTLPSRSK